MFKGKIPLTVCRLTAAGEKALGTYSDRMKSIMQGPRESEQA
jgi:hypothetical protein